MLYFKKQVGFTQSSSVVLLLFISVVTFHSLVFADVKQQTAQEYRDLGFAEQEKGNFDKALSFYIKAVSLGLENATVLNDMGIIYEQVNLLDRAENHYLMAIKKDPKYLPAYSNLAYLYKKSGQKERAFSFFRRRFELSYRGDPWAEKAKQEILQIHPEYEDWFISLEADELSKNVIVQSQLEFEQRINRSQEYLHRGQILSDQGEYKKAIQDFDRAMTLTPNNPQVKKAREKAVVGYTQEFIDKQSKKAIQLLDSGNSISAKNEIQKILATIPDEPINISK